MSTLLHLKHFYRVLLFFSLLCSYVTMEEHLSACEDNLQLKTSQVNTLTLEVQSLKEKVGQLPIYTLMC